MVSCLQFPSVESYEKPILVKYEPLGDATA